MPGAIYTFDFAAWQLQFPEFFYVTQAQADGYFDMATSFWRNDGTGLTYDISQQGRILNVLTAHIAALFSTPPGGTPTTLVGRISSASEGSVSVSTENQYPPGTPQWFQQTKYGSMYWAMTQQYRTFRIIPPIGHGLGGALGGAGVPGGSVGGWPAGRRLY